MSTGFLVGKFAPLTLGHINFINRSSTKCDKLVVLLSYDSKWVSENPEVLTRLLVKAQMTKKVDNEMFMDLSDYAFRDLLGDIDNPEDIDDACKVLGLV